MEYRRSIIFQAIMMREAFSDFFESMFGGSAGGGERQADKFRGQDHHAALQLSLKDAIQPISKH